jgi:hypothetical protein
MPSSVVWRRPAARPRRGRSGGRISRSGNGGPCARTTATRAMRGITSRTTRPARGPIAGARTDWGDQRRPAVALLRAGAVERPGPDSQGAVVRPDQQRGEPWRGREGVLLLSRLDQTGGPIAACMYPACSERRRKERDSVGSRSMTCGTTGRRWPSTEASPRRSSRRSGVGRLRG